MKSMLLCYYGAIVNITETMTAVLPRHINKHNWPIFNSRQLKIFSGNLDAEKHFVAQSQHLAIQKRCFNTKLCMMIDEW